MSKRSYTATIIINTGISAAGRIAVYIAVVYFYVGDVGQGHTRLAGGVSEERIIQLNGLSANSAVIDANLCKKGNDVATGKVAAFQGFNYILVTPDGAVVVGAAARGVVVGKG